MNKNYCRAEFIFFYRRINIEMHLTGTIGNINDILFFLRTFEKFRDYKFSIGKLFGYFEGSTINCERSIEWLSRNKNRADEDNKYYSQFLSAGKHIYAIRFMRRLTFLQRSF